MDHLDAADQFGPVTAGPNRNQFARAEVHGVRVVQMLTMAIAWRLGPFVPLALPEKRKTSKTLLVLAGLSMAALGPLCQAATAATVLSIGDGDTISAGTVL
jgi:hypothetical protein